MASQVTMFFEMGKWGWSEVYHNTLNITDAALLTQVSALANTRRNMLPSAATHVGTRIGTPDVPGAARTIAGLGAGLAGWSSTVDWAFTSVLFREFTAAASITGRVFVRPGPETPGAAGVPDPSAIPAAFINSSLSWQAELTLAGNGWAVRGISTARPTAPILGGTVTATTVTLTTTVNHGILLGELFRVSRVENPAGRCLNGLWRASAVPTLDTVQFIVPTGATATLGPGGTVRGQLPAFEKITSVFPVKIVSRRTGRPFDQPRGRSSRRIRCCPM